MDPRYHPREKGQRLESVEYKKTQKKKKVFATPSPPYNTSTRTRTRSRSRSLTAYYRKKEKFPTPSPPYTKSKSSRKKREKLQKLRNAHGQNEIHRDNFWK